MEASESKIESSESSYQATTEISEQLQKVCVYYMVDLNIMQNNILNKSELFLKDRNVVAVSTVLLKL